MKKLLRIIGLCTVGLGILVFSCVDNEWFSIPNVPNKDFTVQEAKNYFTKNIVTIKQLELSSPQTCCSDPDHHHPVTKSDGEKRTLTLDWGRTIQVTTARSVILNIPVKECIDQLAILIEKNEEQTKAKVVRCYTTFVMEKHIESGQIRTFVTTNLGWATEMKWGKDNPLFYTGDRSTFTGYMVISDVDGDYIDSYSYNNGAHRQVIFQHLKGESELSRETTFRGFHLIDQTTLKTKGGGDDEENECSFCHALLINGKCLQCNSYNMPETYSECCKTCLQPIDYCTCGIYNPSYCSVCGQEVSGCTCSSPFTCPFCQTLYCNGECQNGGGEGEGGGDPEPPQTCTHTKCQYCGNCINGTGTAGSDCTYCDNPCSEIAYHFFTTKCPNASAIFDSNSTFWIKDTLLWQNIENAIVTIQSIGIGANVIGLLQTNLALYNVPDPIAYSSGQVGLPLSAGANQLASSAFHEFFHHAQGFSMASANIEFEAKIAQVDFCVRAGISIDANTFGVGAEYMGYCKTFLDNHLTDYLNGDSFAADKYQMLLGLIEVNYGYVIVTQTPSDNFETYNTVK